MASDPDLLEAFHKQCQHMDPGLVYLAWRGQPGVDDEDLIDLLKAHDLTVRTGVASTSEVDH